MISVTLVDDHIVVRSGFAQLLSIEPDIQVHSEYSNAKDAFRGLSEAVVDVAVIDISMPDESGLVLLEKLRKKHPEFKAHYSQIFTTPPLLSAKQ